MEVPERARRKAEKRAQQRERQAERQRNAALVGGSNWQAPPWLALVQKYAVGPSREGPTTYLIEGHATEAAWMHEKFCMGVAEG